MQKYVIEHIPREEEESQLQQAGDDIPGLMSNVLTIMFVGNRIIAIYEDGNPLEKNAFLGLLIESSKALAIERLGNSLGMSYSESNAEFWSFFHESDENKEDEQPPSP